MNLILILTKIIPKGATWKELPSLYSTTLKDVSLDISVIHVGVKD